MARLLVLSLVCALLTHGWAAENSTVFAPHIPRSYALIIIGISGDEAHYQKFWDLGTQLYRALHERCGYSDEEIFFLFEDQPKERSIVDGRSTREGIEQAINNLAARLRPIDRVFIFVAGHASRSERAIKIHLPGPDITHIEFASFLDRLPTANQIVIVSTPVSGYFMPYISKPGRICITATDALPELSETVFPYHVVRAFADPSADANGDGALSVLEIFRYATAGVKKFFEEQKLIVTEHALLDDDGDGIGRRDPKEDHEGQGDGKRAAQVVFELRAGA